MAATPRRDGHCTYCGERWTDQAIWPRTCTGCSQTSWKNPIPVAVLLVPVDGGLLTIRRGIEPRRGLLALPGGFVNHGESWQQGAARELLEETQVRVDAAGIEAFRVWSPPDGSLVLIFGRSRPLAGSALPPFEPTDETTERVVIAGPTDLAFPLHTEATRAHFSGAPALGS